MQTLPCNLMGHQDQFHPFVRELIHFFHVLLKQFLILRPGTAGNDSTVTILHEIQYRSQTRVIRFEPFRHDLSHAVKTGIACNGAMRHTVLRQKCTRSLVLYEQVGETMQQLQRCLSVPVEEPLGGTEDSRDTISRNTAFLQLLQVRRPELILDENRHRRLQSLYELACVPAGRKRQIQNSIR